MRFYLAAFALALGAAGLQVASVRDEVATFDEDQHLAAGYSYWTTGDFRLNPEHPPLSKLLAAAPLLRWRLDGPAEHPAWPRGDLNAIAPDFLYRNRVPAARMLFGARAVTIGLTALLVLVVAVWGRAQFGAVPALAAAALVALDPNLLAHGRYVTNDLHAALVFLLAVAVWVRYLLSKRSLDLVWAGLALGLALAVKFSMLVLLPVFVAVYAFRAWQDPELSLDRFVGSLLAAGALAGGVVLLVYGGWHGSYGALAQAIPGDGSAARLFRQAGQSLHLPAHPFLLGLYAVASHNESGHAAYLLGRTSVTGWWYYFPVAFAVKTPTAALLLAAAALATAPGWLRGLRRAPLAPVAAGIAIVSYFLFSVSSGINIGLRHLLPVYPLLYLLLTAWAWRYRRAGKFVLLIAVLVQAAECARIHPYYLAFFNSMAGGPAKGPEYLADSNIDWGQDLLRVRRYLDAHGERAPCLAYFGKPDPKLYIPEWRALPYTEDTAARAQLDCLGAISVTLLHDVYPGGGSYAWLRERAPLARVGYSIYVYDLHRPR